MNSRTPQKLVENLREEGGPAAREAAALILGIYSPLATIARGRDNGRPWNSEDARQIARRVLNASNLTWDRKPPGR